MKTHKHIDNQQAETAAGKSGVYFLLAGIFLMSLSVLMFEIALTRIFSVMFYYHYVFVVVSVALFGIGAGGIFIHICSSAFGELFSGRKSFDAISLFVLAFSVAIPVSVILAVKISSESLFVYYPIVFVPFFFSGAAFALIFKRFPEHSSKLYSADLIGAGIACAAVFFALSAIGAVNTVLLLGAVAAISAAVLALRSEKKTTLAACCIVLVTLVLFFVSNVKSGYITDIPVRKVTDEVKIKELYAALSNPYLGAEIVETRWSPYGRTDLVNLKNDSSQKIIYVDGESPSPMYRFNGDLNSVSHLKNFAGYFPFYFPEKDKVLAIGAGAGRDVLIALLAGSKEITAVEINQDIVDMVRDTADYNGGVYTDYENVNVIVDEGRSFIRRSREEYDIILISLAITETSGSAGTYALVENYLYTVEAVDDYLKHLTENGRLVFVTHIDLQVLKLFGMGVKSLQNGGVNVTDAKNHIAVVGDGLHRAFILKKTAFTKPEVEMMRRKIREADFIPIYMPFENVRGASSGLFSRLVGRLGSNGIDLASWTRKVQPHINLQQPTDNRPFFFKWQKGVPDSLASLLGYMLIPTVAVIIAPMLYKSNFLSRKRKRRNPQKDKGIKGTATTAKTKDIIPFVVYFSMLGVGFMLIEISLIQKIILFLGRPTLAITVLLFSLLLSGGIGSYTSNLLNKEKSLKFVARISLLICIIVLIYALTLTHIFVAFLGFSLVVRCIISAALLSPLGFLMGMPFPQGIKALKEKSKEDIPWMLGINGSASVIGSILAVVIAISAGFSWALLLGAFAYSIVCFVGFRYS